jgi:homogentisate 1,2-dioxygenase
MEGDGATEPEGLAGLSSALERARAQRVLLVTGASARHVERVRPFIGERTLTVFTGARRHVPESVITEATRVLGESNADTVIALGGGSAIGLGKALRLTHDVTLIAIPTTYAGSEYTNIHGRVVDGKKVTGRDDRVRPSVVIHDLELTLDMPKTLSVTSLLNALAHPLGAIVAEASKYAVNERALRAIEITYGAIEALLRAPGDRHARTAALRGAALSGQVLESAKLGSHHQLAHRLGGELDLEHAALHSVLLPHTVHRARKSAAEAVAAVESRLGVVDLEGTLFDFLIRAGAPASLKALGVDGERFERLLAKTPDLAREFLSAVFHGRRPSARTRQEDWGLREWVSVHGPSLENAERAVVAIHGRGATADSVLGRVLEISGNAPGIAVVAPHAPDNAWYAGRYGSKRSELAELETVVSELGVVLDRVVSAVGAENVVVYGFSQGACLAIELVLRQKRSLSALVALSGGAIGPESEWPKPAPALAGMRVLLGASLGDPWLGSGDVERTARHLESAGLSVSLVMAPGETHRIHDEQRALARALITGTPPVAPSMGFGNTHQSEALEGALPRNQNAPRLAPFGLYVEQISGAPFTAPRAENLRVWLYRIRPATDQGELLLRPHPTFNHDFLSEPPEPNLLGFAPLSLPDEPTDFVDGLHTLGGAGSAERRRGYAVHLYAANRNMEDRAFVNADGDLLILPELGALSIQTELGHLAIEPGELAIVPRGIRFSVALSGPVARGYVAEAFGRHFRLPEHGVFGPNGLADARHFRAPSAWHEDRLAPGYRITTKLSGLVYETEQDHSPFDVVAWQGNYVPYAYDLSLFSPGGNTRFDHVDPSIHTVIGAPLDEQGTAALDLVVFAPRWDASENTFRPPYFHRNLTTEINGIVREPVTRGTFFVPGVVFVTPGMTPHGPGAALARRTFAESDERANAPHRYSEAALWFQFETTLPFSLSRWAKDAPERVRSFSNVWGVHRSRFLPEP